MPGSSPLVSLGYLTSKFIAYGFTSWNEKNNLGPIASGRLLMVDPYCTVYRLWTMRPFASLHSILNCSIDPVDHKVHFTIL